MSISRTRVARAWLLLTTTLGLAATAHAQSAPPSATQDEEIIVVGQRLAQQRAIDIRRDADAIVDAIAADDIGRLADKNVAENIERLPGVSLKYDQGEGRFVSLRGIDGALNNVTIGGVDLGSPEGDTRQLPLDVIGGQLLSRVEVIKAVTPDMDGQAIGGSVNLELQSPYDFDQPFFFRASAQAGEHELNDTTPYAGEFAIGGVFGANDQFGVLIGASYQERDFRSYGLYPDDWSAVAGSRRGIPINIKYTTYDLLRERTGAAARFEWRPNDDHRVYVQGLYSLFTEDEYRQRYRLDFGTVAFNADGVTATATGGERRQDLRLEQKDKSILNVTFGSEHTLGAWDVDTLASWGRNELDEPNYVWLFRSGGIPGGTVSSTLNFGPLLYGVTPAAEVAPSALQFRQLTIQDNIAEEDILTGAINARRAIAFGEDSFVQFGVRVRDAEKVQDNSNDRYDRGTAANRFTLADFNLLGAPTATFLDDVSYVNRPTIDAGAIRAFTAANLGSARMVFNGPVSQQADIASDYTVEERVTAGYAMASLDFGRLTVLGGVRVEQTETDVTGFETRGLGTASAVIAPVSRSGEYTTWLPGLHLRYEGDNDMVLRGAITRTLGRPQYGQLSPGGSIDIGVSPPRISRGDPGLEPYLSTNIDAAFDWYFAPGAVFGFGLFHKDIEGFIFTQTQRLQNVTYLGDTFAEVTVAQPANGGDARVSGIEVNYQQQFDFLPGALSGLGLGANLTLTDSDLDGQPLPRQSDRVWGVQLFYQKYGIEGVVAYHYTSAYLDTVGANPSLNTYFNRFRRLDAKVSYALTDNLSVFIEGQNLNDETLWEYQGGRPDWPIGYEQYGRTTYIGLTASW